MPGARPARVNRSHMRHGIVSVQVHMCLPSGITGSGHHVSSEDAVGSICRDGTVGSSECNHTETSLRQHMPEVGRKEQWTEESSATKNREINSIYQSATTADAIQEKILFRLLSKEGSAKPEEISL